MLYKNKRLKLLSEAFFIYVIFKGFNSRKRYIFYKEQMVLYMKMNRNLSFVFWIYLIRLVWLEDKYHTFNPNKMPPKEVTDHSTILGVKPC